MVGNVDAPEPLRRLPEVEVRHDQTHRSAVVGLDRRAVVLVRDEHVVTQQVRQRHVGRVAVLGGLQDVGRTGRRAATGGRADHGSAHPATGCRTSTTWSHSGCRSGPRWPATRAGRTTRTSAAPPPVRRRRATSRNGPTRRRARRRRAGPGTARWSTAPAAGARGRSPARPAWPGCARRSPCPRVRRPAGQRGTLTVVPAGPDRRRLGTRAVGDPPRRRGRRRDPRRRGATSGRRAGT